MMRFNPMHVEFITYKYYSGYDLRQDYKKELYIRGLLKDILSLCR